MDEGTVVYIKPVSVYGTIQHLHVSIKSSFIGLHAGVCFRERLQNILCYGLVAVC